MSKNDNSIWRKEEIKETKRSWPDFGNNYNPYFPPNVNYAYKYLFGGYATPADWRMR